jgi:phospholipid transport system substrate-binding protein
MNLLRSPLLSGFILLPGLALAQGAPESAPAAPASAPQSAPAGDEAPAHPVEKPIRTLINAVRFGKFDLALKFMSAEPLGAALLGDDWAKGTPEQQAEFVKLFHQVFAKVAFPKMKERFEHIQAILYDPPEVTGDQAKIKSVIVILHAMKKQELKVTYTLVKAGEDWKILDAKVLGDSMVDGIRQDQIIPIMQEGGWANLLDLLRKKAAG